MVRPVAAAAAGSAPTARWQILASLAELPTHQYSAVLLDQFGVLHDGQKPYPGAIEAVRHMAEDSGLRILIISNSSRRAAGALANLCTKGFDPGWFAGVVTSGEVTHRHLLDRPDAFWRQLGMRCLHFTWAGRGAISLAGLGLEVTTDPEQAQFVLAHGTEALGTPVSSSGGGDTAADALLVAGLPQPATLDEMVALLRVCAARRLPLIVANPDVVTVDGTQLRPMPGWLARQYEAMGGEVHLMGKPAPLIYQAALEMLGLPPAACLAVGDSLEHDIAGAAAAGVDSAFIVGGIHAEDVGLEPDGGAAAAPPAAAAEGGGSGAGAAAPATTAPQPPVWTFSEGRLAELCEGAGVVPTYCLPYLAL